MWLMVSSQSPHSLHLLFCCVLSILVLIWLVLTALFCAAIWRNLVSLLRFPFRSHVHYYYYYYHYYYHKLFSFTFVFLRSFTKYCHINITLLKRWAIFFYFTLAGIARYLVNVFICPILDHNWCSNNYWYGGIFKVSLFFQFLFLRLISLVDRVFANGRVIPKTLIWYLITLCLILSIIRYVSRVKLSNPVKGTAGLHYTLV